MAWAITEAIILRGRDDLDEEAFSDEIRFYMGEMLNREGIVSPPDVLAIALRDTEVSDPLAVSADDPELYSAFFKNQSTTSEAIQLDIQRQLKELLHELGRLQLEDGDTSNLISKLGSELG